MKWKTEFCERAFPIHRRVVKQTRRLRIKPTALIFFTSRFPLDHVPMVRLSKIHTRANPRRSRRSKRDWRDREPRQGKYVGRRQVDNRLQTAFCVRAFVECSLLCKRGNNPSLLFPIRYREISPENSAHRWWTGGAYSL